MIRKMIWGLVLGGMLIACQHKQPDQDFLISKQQIGALTPQTTVSQVQSVFKNDSVVNENTSQLYSNGNEVVVYTPQGDILLRLKPRVAFDSTSTIASVEVIDSRFQTEDGLRVGANFDLLKKNYKISRIENILGAVLVFVDEMNIYVSIDKKEILNPKELGNTIKLSQIKNDAKIKHLWLTW